MNLLLFANTDWYLYNFRLSLALRAAGHDLLLLTSLPGAYGGKLLAADLRWQPLRMDRRSLNTLRESRLLWQLWRLLRREPPDLVHGFTIKCAVHGLLAARLAEVPARINPVTVTARRTRSSVLAWVLRRGVARWRGRAKWKVGICAVSDLKVHPVTDANAMQGYSRIGSIAEAEWRYLPNGQLAVVAHASDFGLGTYHHLMSELAASHPTHLDCQKTYYHQNVTRSLA